MTYEEAIKVMPGDWVRAINTSDEFPLEIQRRYLVLDKDKWDKTYTLKVRHNGRQLWIPNDFVKKIEKKYI